MTRNFLKFSIILLGLLNFAFAEEDGPSNNEKNICYDHSVGRKLDAQRIENFAQDEVFADCYASFQEHVGHDRAIHAYTQPTSIGFTIMLTAQKSLFGPTYRLYIDWDQFPAEGESHYLCSSIGINKRKECQY